MQVGVGMCMEGIEHNPIVYELMSEMAFRDEKVKINVMLLYIRSLEVHPLKFVYTSFFFPFTFLALCYTL